jgi:hypothetical protein
MQHSLIRVVVVIVALGAAAGSIAAQTAQAPPSGAEKGTLKLYREPAPRVHGVPVPQDVAAAIRDQQKAFTCALPGTAERFKVNQEVKHAGQAYRCVETFTSDDSAPGATRLMSKGVAWIKVDGK